MKSSFVHYDKSVTNIAAYLNNPNLVNLHNKHPSLWNFMQNINETVFINGGLGDTFNNPVSTIKPPKPLYVKKEECLGLLKATYETIGGTHYHNFIWYLTKFSWTYGRSAYLITSL